MKKLILITAFLSSLVFTSVCFAEWTLLGTDVKGNRVYIDLKTIQIKNKRSVFFWVLTDRAKPVHGDLSSKTFWEADCGIPRKERILAFSTYPQPMAQGDPSLTSSKTREWDYHPPGSVMETILNKVCALAEKKFK